MYLFLYCLINSRGPDFWLHLLICVCVTVHYCNPKHDNIGMWLLKLKRVFEESLVIKNA